MFHLARIGRPTIHHTIMFAHTGRMHIGYSQRSTGIREFVLGNLQRLHRKIDGETRFVQNRFPQKDRSMVAVATNHMGNIVQNIIFELRRFVPILPTGRRHNHKNTQFIASIHPCRVLRIVSRTNNGTTAFAQNLGIAPVLRVRNSIAHIGKILVTIDTDQLFVRLTIQIETIFAFKFHLANTGTQHTAIQSLFTLFQHQFHLIKIRIVGRPQFRLFHHERLFHRLIVSSRYF